MQLLRSFQNPSCVFLFKDDDVWDMGALAKRWVSSVVCSVHLTMQKHLAVNNIHRIFFLTMQYPGLGVLELMNSDLCEWYSCHCIKRGVAFHVVENCR
jgi:hypothetical protein